MVTRRAALTVAACFTLVAAMVYADVTLRARSAYYEGIKYLQWNEHPELKAAALDADLAAQEYQLRREAAAGKMTPAELDERLKLARFARDQAFAESSLKYAYVWFQTAVELFSPPESRWVAQSRQEMIRTKELWKKELDAKHIRYQDYMLE